jgi:hypothetical protein
MARKEGEETSSATPHSPPRCGPTSLFPARPWGRSQTAPPAAAQPSSNLRCPCLHGRPHLPSKPDALTAPSFLHFFSEGCNTRNDANPLRRMQPAAAASIHFLQPPLTSQAAGHAQLPLPQAELAQNQMPHGMATALAAQIEAQTGPDRDHAAVGWPQPPGSSTAGTSRKNSRSCTRLDPPFLHSRPAGATDRSPRPPPPWPAKPASSRPAKPAASASSTRAHRRGSRAAARNSASPAGNAPHARPPPASTLLPATFGSGPAATAAQAGGSGGGGSGWGCCCAVAGFRPRVAWGATRERTFSSTQIINTAT